ncbi:ABC transporter permease/M1 family aminopeptidase [Marivirga sp.]|uniref:ABC transporter permease/M1 family aminopeptidase n=1 Tax=Marivirga sp. TaxID=2018662 RepID=UPI002D7E860F|nr:M1 family aminopeptidase [Marivirga sp.]HET8860292.1 M1 family aminopeptidase [Marivirga sp.]
MFKHFFTTELKYTFKQPMIYIFTALLGLLVFFAVVSDNVTIGGSVGNVYRNAPHIIAVYTGVMTIFGLIIATAFFNNAALRDYQNQFNEILFSTPIKKAGYFFGRFFGALILATIPMLGVFLGILIGSALAPVFGWIEADRFGAFYLSSFVNNYFFIVLPNMFFAGAIIFAFANIWKNTVISFVGALAVIVAYIISGTLMSDIENESMAALLDTFGIRTYSFMSKYYTPVEKNEIGLQLTPIFIYNRLIWFGAGLIILLSSYFTFSFKQKSKKVKAEKKENAVQRAPFALPNVNINFSSGTSWRQFRSFFFINFLSIIKSTTFKILIIFSLLMLISNLVGGFEYFGLQSYPVTYKMLDIISSVSGLFTIIIVVFFSGELIWRDKDNNINEVIDATPHQSFVSLIAKVTSLVAITIVLYAFFVLSAVIYQLGSGYTRIELGLYFSHFFITYLGYYIIYSMVMVLIHAMVSNKYIGYFISILLIFALDIILLIADVQSNMISLGATPRIIYSDMNAFGPALISTVWFNFYWISFALICLFLATLIWKRGTQANFKEKVQLIKKGMPKSFKISFFIVIAVWISLSSFVFYNTQVINEYDTSDEREEQAAEYEKTFKKYEDVELPKIAGINYFIDIFPYKRDAIVKAEVTLTNPHEVAIDSLHFSCDSDWNTEIIIEGAELVFKDEKFDYRIYKLSNPFQPGDTLKATINTSYITKGFEDEVSNTSIVENGTFLNNFQVLPFLGYNDNYEISDNNTRKKYDLPEKERMPALQEDCGPACDKNYLTGGLSDFIDVETVISTASDQIAIAPGSLIREWEEDGRNYFHYKVDHPSLNFYSFISARFEVAREKWNDVDVEIYYDKKHEVNIPKMTAAVKKSLEYYTENFGPYYHEQVRIIEFPRYSTFAQAFPGTMPYSESFGFVINLEDESENNVIDAVIAHEIAHQYWAHQVIGAEMQGSTMFSEGFSEYSSLMTMKNETEDPMKMREFNKYNHNRYLGGRSGELEKEMPLYKVENQGYIHYGKGSVVLFALQDYIGEENVNRAMKGFLEEYRYKGPPYPTSLDFLEYLEPEVPDSLKYLIDDWFKEITLYDNRMKEATYTALDNGKYEVNLQIESKKIKADSLGNETVVEINDWIDIGLFADAEEEKLMWQKRVKIDQENMEFTFEVDTIPAKAGIDPRHLLIDRVFNDNIKSVKEKLVE